MTCLRVDSHPALRLSGYQRALLMTPGRGSTFMHTSPRLAKLPSWGSAPPSLHRVSGGRQQGAVLLSIGQGRSANPAGWVSGRGGAAGAARPRGHCAIGAFMPIVLCTSAKW
jgi:hypothetical protein